MANNFLKWLGEELGGQVLFGGLTSILKEFWNASGVKEGLGKKAAQVVSDAFHHDWSDEQFYNLATVHTPVTIADRIKLDSWLAHLKTDEQRNMFRKSVLQFKRERSSENQYQVFDPENTAKILHAIGEYDDEQWKMYIKNMNLHRPIPAKRFILIMKRKQKGLANWLSEQNQQAEQFVQSEFVPFMSDQANAIRQRRRQGFDW